MKEDARGSHFSTSGSAETIKTHEKLVSYHNRMETIRTAWAYAASVCFAGIAALLLILDPPGVGPIAILAAGGLLVLAAALRHSAASSRFFGPFS